MSVLETSLPSRVPNGELAGFDVSKTEWRLNLDRYREFIGAVTESDPDATLSASDCYRIGNRLEAFIDEKRRTGALTSSLVDEHPELDSLEQVYWLSRFFRQCHEDCLPPAGR